MINSQREQNPDTNSYNPDTTPGETPGTTDGRDGSSDIERNQDDKGSPVPPNATPAAPVEEPPGSENGPVGDVDDSPERIA
ncbi:MAG: hypothetical protein ABIO91_00780 [Pyrinomonadaceae bacterium]